MSNERRMVPRTQATRERELLTLDYHGREVKTRVLEEDRKAVRAARDAEWRAAVALASDLHSNKCFRWLTQNNTTACNCGADIANTKLDALLAAMEAK